MSSPTCQTGIDGETTPAIGPTAPWWWHGSTTISPAASARSASAGVVAHPSRRAAPTSAPRIGPHIRANAIGGPACSIVRPGPSSASITARAGRMPSTRGRTACTAAIAAALAAAVVSSSRAIIARAAATSENAGGRQSSCVTSAAGTPSTIRGSPALTTCTPPAITDGLPRRAGSPAGSRRRWNRRAAHRPRATCAPGRRGPADRRPCRRSRRRRPRPGAGGRPHGGRHRARWVGVGAVAEHDVEQHHADRRVLRGRRDARRARRRIDHRVRSARGVLVVAEVEHLGRHTGPAEQHLRLPGERAPGVQPEHAAGRAGLPPTARRPRAPA